MDKVLTDPFYCSCCLSHAFLKKAYEKELHIEKVYRHLNPNLLKVSDMNYETFSNNPMKEDNNYKAVEGTCRVDTYFVEVLAVSFSFIFNGRVSRTWLRSSSFFFVLKPFS